MEGKPEKVKRARLAGDIEKLSKMGAGGNIRSELRNAYKKTMEKELADKEFAERERIYHVSAEGDVLPPDPDIVASLEDKPPKTH